MNLPYHTIQDLVATLGNRHFPRFRVLPYNRFDFKHSQHWWLSPARENPAFRYGKVRFTTNDDWIGDGRVFCGFDVEKGLLHEGDWPKTCIMDDTWFWHRFLNLANEPLAAAIDEAAKASGVRMQIYLAAGIPTPGDPDRARIQLNVEGGSMSLIDTAPPKGVLAGIASSTTFPEFADALRALDGATTAWQWIDVLVGQTFTLDVEGPDDTDACAGMLKAFETWMRAD